MHSSLLDLLFHSFCSCRLDSTDLADSGAVMVTLSVALCHQRQRCYEVAGGPSISRVYRYSIFLSDLSVWSPKSSSPIVPWFPDLNLTMNHPLIPREIHLVYSTLFNTSQQIRRFFDRSLILREIFQSILLNICQEIRCLLNHILQPDFLTHRQRRQQ